MAAPSNVFRRVDGPEPDAVTVTLWALAGRPVGDVVGPRSESGTPGFALGEDGSLTAHQAIAVGCHLANQAGAEVVVVDRGDQWQPGWGRLATP